MDKWIVVVTEKEAFDCILDHRLFDTQQEAEARVAQAGREDAEQEWNYKYRVVAVRLND